MAFRFPAALRVIGRSMVDWWDSWLDIVGAVLLWLVAQFTVILGPPATFGLYYVAYNLVNGESLGVRGLIDGARRYFGKSWLWALANLFFFAVLFANFKFYGGFQAEWVFYVQVVLLLIGWLWIMTQLFALPYWMEMPQSGLFRVLRNGFLTCMAAPVFSFALFIFAVLVLALSFGLLIPVLFGLPALVPLSGIRGMYDRLEAYGLKEREKSPKELERHESGQVNAPKVDQSGDKDGR